MGINPTCPVMLPDLDSNQDIQIQNLTYYPYTIGQCNKKGKKNKD